MLPPDIMEQILDEGLHLGNDDGGGDHYRLLTSAPQPILEDLRYASKTELVTVWQSPKFRAILMASQGAGELVLYQSQAQYDLAIQAARQGIYPTLDRQR